MVFKEFMRRVWIIKVEIVHAHIKLSLCTFLMRVLNSHRSGVDMYPLTMVFKIITCHKELENEIFSPQPEDSGIEGYQALSSH